jgi:hypothetical protein
VTAVRRLGLPSPRPPNGGIWPHEIEEGRSVVNDWAKELFETWAQRKARLARERAVLTEAGKALP